MILQHYIVVLGVLASIAYWRMPERWQMPFISVLTALFLLIHAPLSLLVLVCSTVLVYYASHVIRSKNLALWCALLPLVALFVFFKADFRDVLELNWKFIVPLGFSYYAFRQIHYVFEVFKGSVGRHDIRDLFYYQFFFPTLLMGPINRFPNFKRDSRRKRWDPELYAAGLQRMVFGYAKVVLLAEVLFNQLSGKWIEVVTNPWWRTYLECIEFTANTYMQFAGYSDIAIGLSLLLGYKVMENFNKPYQAPNINDFWQRWHISLSQWCRDYVYTPIAALTRQPLIAILASMIVLGLWHEVSLRYLCWAFYHGIGIGIWHLWSRKSWQLTGWMPQNIRHSLSIALTFNFVVISFIFVKESTWQAIADQFQTLITLGL